MGDRLATIDNWGLCPNVTQCGLAKTYVRTKWHLDPSSRLATTNMVENWGLYPRFEEGELGPHLAQCGPHLAQCGLSRGLPPYQVAS